MNKRMLLMMIALSAAMLAAQDKPLQDYIREAWALSEEGKISDGITLMKEGVAAYPTHLTPICSTGCSWENWAGPP